MNITNISKEDLANKYTGAKYDLIDLSIEFNCCVNTIRSKLIQYSLYKPRLQNEKKKTYNNPTKTRILNK